MCRRHEACTFRPSRDGTVTASPSMLPRGELEQVKRSRQCNSQRTRKVGAVKATRWQNDERQVAGRDKQEFFARSSWKQAGASDEIIEALQGLGISKPSHVQGEAYTALLSGARSADRITKLLETSSAAKFFPSTLRDAAPISNQDVRICTVLFMYCVVLLSPGSPSSFASFAFLLPMSLGIVLVWLALAATAAQQQCRFLEFAITDWNNQQSIIMSL